MATTGSPNRASDVAEVAVEVAAALGAPLDVIVVRKLGVPFQPELAMGAIGDGGVRVLDRDVLAAARVTEAAARTATGAAVRSRSVPLPSAGGGPSGSRRSGPGR